jgi:hypothetical protein
MFNLILTYFMVLATVATVYWYWIRPLLRQTPAFRELYDQSDSFRAALALKFVGSKQKLTAAFLTMASSVVMVYNFIAPAMTGVDITPLTASMPNWAWPLIVIGFTALLNYFRTLADERASRQIDALSAEIKDDAKVAKIIEAANT